MRHADTYITFLVAILGIAYPIIIQVISRIEDKYNSQSIALLFEKEVIHIVYFVTLICSIVVTILWTWDMPPLRYAVIEFMFESSSDWFIFTFITMLIIVFILEVKLLMTYSVTIKLAKRIIKQYNRRNDSSGICFTAASDLLICALRNGHQDAFELLSEFIGGEFEEFRRQDLNFPKLYYDIDRKLLIEMLTSDEFSFKALRYRVATASYLLGSELSDKISRDTLTQIWHNLILMLESNHIDMYMLYWESMDNRLRNFRFRKRIGRKESSIDMDSTDNESIKESLDMRMVRYHCALGGLVLYLQKHEAIRRMFLYTSSEPPDYHLLPNTLREVYKLFVYFFDPWGDNFSFISSDYYFPHNEGIAQDKIVPKWICSYIAILFFRLHTLRPHHFGQDSYCIEELPTSQRKKLIWLNCIEGFRRSVKEWIEQPELLYKMGIGDIDQNWSIDKMNPDLIIDKIKGELIEAMDKTILEQGLSPDKVKTFLDSSSELIQKYILSLKRTTSSTLKDFVGNRSYAYGKRILLEKSCFQADEVLSADNYDKILASMVIANLKHILSHSFVANASAKYQFKPEDIFLAIDKLKLDKNIHLIINMNLNLSFYIDVQKVQDLTLDDYKGIEIVSLDSYDRSSGYSLFILEKEKLPYLNFVLPTNEERAKFKLSDSIYEGKIFASVIDLKDDEDLRAELEPKNTDKDLKRYVLACIAFVLEIQWSKDVKIVQIQQLLHRDSQQLLSNLSDVPKFLTPSPC
ncbi:MAG: hypothetical protein Q8M98_00550 [Candidatus Cloacimonadaceae bacterium]|nr:hypothetical protein [Candidatus Cloacimonadaceae bacterium]